MSAWRHFAGHRQVPLSSSPRLLLSSRTWHSPSPSTECFSGDDRAIDEDDDDDDEDVTRSVTGAVLSRSALLNGVKLLIKCRRGKFEKVTHLPSLRPSLPLSPPLTTYGWERERESTRHHLTSSCLFRDGCRRDCQSDWWKQSQYLALFVLSAEMFIVWIWLFLWVVSAHSALRGAETFAWTCLSQTSSV